MADKIDVFSLEQAINYGSNLLAAVSDSAKLDAQLLVAFVIEKPTSYLFTWPEQQLTEAQQQSFLALIARREKGEPVAYLIGEKEFWSLPLKVSPVTLIPRPDTEVLVEQVLARHTQENLTCLDLGTGTGAIALALAHENPSWQVEAVDFQAQAVELARDNAQALSISNVKLYQSDWFSDIESTLGFDIIVSNPPYIDQHDQHLFSGDVVFEPRTALVAENNGYADIQLIAEQAREYLRDGGYLYLEHGFEQANGVQHILNELGYCEVQTVKDYNNNDRITLGCYYQA